MFALKYLTFSFDVFSSGASTRSLKMHLLGMMCFSMIKKYIITKQQQQKNRYNFQNDWKHLILFYFKIHKHSHERDFILYFFFFFFCICSNLFKQHGYITIGFIGQLFASNVIFYFILFILIHKHSYESFVVFFLFYF